MLFLSVVEYFALGVLAKFYVLIKFAARLCLQDPKFSLAMFAVRARVHFIVLYRAGFDGNF